MYTQLNNTGRMDANKLIKIENGASVMDFMFDPFNNRRIAIGLNNIHYTKMIFSQCNV